MITLNFLYDTSKETQLYILTQEERDNSFKVFYNEELIAEIDQVKDKWIQISGGSLDNLLLHRIGEFIDRQNYRKLPNEIKKHWLMM